jgi:predicted HTH transcriptional regulator
VNGPQRIFISSVQREFSAERLALRDYLRNDPLLRRFFEPFIFEDVPAADRRPDEVYLDEVARCDVFIALFGNEYGAETDRGLSPVHRELEHATQLGKHRLVFIKSADADTRHPKMQALIREAESGLVRRRFATPAELIAGVYASLVHYLEENELIRHGPFDAAPCRGATLTDLDPERIAWFLREARRARGFPLSENATPEELLAHLNLFDDRQLTHAAVLLFGRQPQRFLMSSEVKCAHFHGTEVAKPIPSYQVYKGTVFELVDQAVDFVLSKIALAVGTRDESTQAPVAYELPAAVVREAIVNAVAHRDYTSHGSVQVMLFSDRLEVWNPGRLPTSLTLQQLREPHGSVPRNPLIAEPLYLTKYIERMGTGTRDMIRLCRAAGLPEPDFEVRDGFVTRLRRPAASAATGQPATQATTQATQQANPREISRLTELASALGLSTPQATPQVTAQVTKVLLAADAELGRSRDELQRAIEMSDREHFRKTYLEPLLTAGWLERTLPDKPTSPHQRYRLTEKGRSWLSETPGKS